jgi:hypothetical protein
MITIATRYILLDDIDFPYHPAHKDTTMIYRTDTLNHISTHRSSHIHHYPYPKSKRRSLMRNMNQMPKLHPRYTALSLQLGEEVISAQHQSRC